MTKAPETASLADSAAVYVHAILFRTTSSVDTIVIFAVGPVYHSVVIVDDRHRSSSEGHNLVAAISSKLDKQPNPQRQTNQLSR
jgi:hypothetical protein